jgi:hypothetical protein
MQIALYKKGQNLFRDPGKFLAHVAICIRTLSKYSHCELVIDGVCWSSSARDGGVRAKEIDLTTGHWDVFYVADDLNDKAAALAWFLEHEGDRYDWLGIVRFVLPFVKQSPGKQFCSEAVDAALGGQNSYKVSPKDLLKYTSQ